MGSEYGSSDLRVASFSYYLKSPDDNFVLKLAGMQDAVPPFMTPPETPALGGIGRITKENQRDLSIFGADKYFSGRMDYDKHGVMDLHHVKPSIFTPRTPSMSSEATSWNSQSVLLQRNPSQIKQKNVICKRFFPSFGCNGSCATEKDVYVNENGSDSKRTPSQSGFKRGDQFAFPVPDPEMKIKKPFEDDPRKSIEVFGSNTRKKGDIAKNLERKLSIVTWDAIPKAQEQLPSTTHVSSGVCDDMASDASSDLFEIENIYGAGFSPMNGQPSERLSNCSMMSPTTQYAPSEASIQWSIVTASAADFSSAMSEYDENIFSDKKNGKGKTVNITKDTQKLRSTGLLGCKSIRSVRVAEFSHRAADKPKY